ncbi:MAG: hypothetical protein UR26_C0003G0035 [candidate division TM6 bacterium GW2011_GWF2_32_72]|nr:MAG: hypothetical protein UR26_C0003G0035 [candidate division TM6 bacterium GW2011_GWF2_32_72]
MNKKIFVTYPIPGEGLDVLKSKGYEIVVSENKPTKQELISAVKKYDALISLLSDLIDKEVIDAANKQLKIIANYAVGFDNIDLKGATSKNIIVTNTPGTSSEAVAEFTIGLMLNITRKIVEADKFIRAGFYKGWEPELLLGMELREKTLGIVGLGHIGTRVAKIANRGFDMKILYTDVAPNKEFEKDHCATFMNLDELLAQSDIVTLHVPLFPSTHHLIDLKQIKKMKKSAFLINTSRGPVVNEKDLAEALDNNLIAGAAIDVYEFEPKITEKLLNLKNIILTPHVASATQEARNSMSLVVAQNVDAVLRGGKAITPVNII